MKAALAFLLFAALAQAQDSTAVAASQAACGSKNVNFDAKADPARHPTPQPDAGTALVYVVEDLGQCSDCDIPRIGGPVHVSGAILKVGMDGTWVGAGKGASYFSFPAAPGEHHLCINWQSSLEGRARAFAFANFTAEAGQVYYFRARLFPGSADYSFDLGPINSDEGKYLVASSPLSVSHPKR